MTLFKYLLTLCLLFNSTQFQIGHTQHPPTRTEYSITSQQEEPFEFIAIKSLYPEVEEELLIGLEFNSTAFQIRAKEDLNYHLYQDLLPSEHLLSPPEWLRKKLNNEKTIVATFGDHNSPLTTIVQALTNQTNIDSRVIIRLTDLQHILTKPPNNETTLVTILQLKTLMENLGIQSLHYTPIEIEFPTDSSFTQWPDTIISLDFLYGSGLTVSPVSGEFLKKGYVVALEGHSQVIPASEFFSTSDQSNGKAVMKDYLAKKALLFLQPHIFFGIWHDTSSDLVFLDLSEVFNDLEEAIQAGKERNQIAIFDLSTGTTIYTGGTGGITLQNPSEINALKTWMEKFYYHMIVQHYSFNSVNYHLQHS